MDRHSELKRSFSLFFNYVLIQKFNQEWNIQIIDTTGQVKKRNLDQIQNLLDEISLTSSKTKKENMYVDLLIIIS